SVVAVALGPRRVGVVVLVGVDAGAGGLSGQLLLKTSEVRLRSVVLQFASNLGLLRLRAASAHWPDPLGNGAGPPRGAHRKCEYLPAHRIACPARNVRPGRAPPCPRRSGGATGPLRLAAEPADRLTAGLGPGLAGRRVGVDGGRGAVDVEGGVRGDRPLERREGDRTLLVVLDHGAEPADGASAHADVGARGRQVVPAGAVELQPDEHARGLAEVVDPRDRLLAAVAPLVQMDRPVL